MTERLNRTEHTVESTYFFCVNVYLSAIFTLCQSRILGGKTDKIRLNTFPINPFFNYPGQQEICINDIYIYISKHMVYRLCPLW